MEKDQEEMKKFKTGIFLMEWRTPPQMQLNTNASKQGVFH